MTMIEKFKDVYKTNIRREGADRFYDYLMSTSDFPIAPASTRFHGAYEGGLPEHSLNVYDCLRDYLARTRVKDLYGMEYTEETIAISALLHDVCKIGCYKKGTRNVKDTNGIWKSVPVYEFDDKLPYGHGEKSVYIISGYMKLTREEAFAIRYHMGFSSTDDTRNVSTAFEMFPLAFALSVADSEATFFIESKEKIST